MAQLVTKADLARIAGVTGAAITKACVKQFPGALVGDRVDLEHADVIRYLGARDRTSTRSVARAIAPAATVTPARAPTSPPEAAGFAPGTLPGSSIQSPSAPPSSPASPYLNALGGAPAAIDNAHREVSAEDIMRYGHMSLNALLEKFGTATAFGDFLDARKRMSDIREKDLKNDERTGRLIPRDWVRTHVFGHIDSVYKRLLQDTAPTLVRRIYEAAKSGVPVEQAEAMGRDMLGKSLRALKDGSIMGLRSLEKEAA